MEFTYFVSDGWDCTETAINVELTPEQEERWLKACSEHARYWDNPEDNEEIKDIYEIAYKEALEYEADNFMNYSDEMKEYFEGRKCSLEEACEYVKGNYRFGIIYPNDMD